MFTPGELDKRVIIEREINTPDRFGGQILTVSTVATVWAHIRPKSAREFIQDTRVNNSTAYLFVIRWRSDIQPSDRLVWLGVSYNITGILDKGPRELYLEIDTERGVAQ